MLRCSLFLAANIPAALAGCGDPPAPMNSSVPNVLIIGDSISMGSSGYSKYVAAMLNRPGYELASVQHSGGFGPGGQAGDTKNGLKCIDGWLGGRAWDVITINFGIHDCDAGRAEYNPPAAYRSNLKTILSKAKRASKATFFVTTTPNGGVFNMTCVAEYNELALQVVKELDVGVVDLSAYVYKYCGQNYTLCPIQLDNNVHFTTRPPRPSGQQYTGFAVAEAIIRALPWPNKSSSPSLEAHAPAHAPTPNCGRPPTALSVELPNVLLIGDSISGDQLGYGPLVRDMLELRSGPAGMPNGSLAAVQHNGGWTSDGPTSQQAGATTVGVSCIAHWLGTGGWDVISFNFGIHDCEDAPQHTDPEVYRANLETIARAARAGLREGGALVWTSTTPPPYPQATDHASVVCVDQRNAIARETLAQFDVVVNDLHSEFNGACGANFTSCPLQLPNHNVHPTPAGRQFLAIKTASVIAPLLNSRKQPLAPQLPVDDITQMLHPEQPRELII